MSHTDNAQVLDNPERTRFELHLQDRVIGFAQYRRHPGRMVLPHVEVDPDYRGRGLAGQLTRQTLEAARSEGLRVTPLCPYVADYIRTHPEYTDLVDERGHAGPTSSTS